MQTSGIKLGVLVICGLAPTLSCNWLNHGTPNPTSDVPCLAPTAWPKEIGGIFTRADLPGTGALLLAYYTTNQRIFDRNDQILGNDPHGPVYLFQPESESFAQVDDVAWGNASSEVDDCTLGSLFHESPFSKIGGLLQFEGRNIGFAGRVVLNIITAPSSPVVAVLSTDGDLGGFPGFIPGGSSGQHFHQLFSELDGKSVGSAIRIGVGGFQSDPVQICWTSDERYVIYYQSSDMLQFDIEKLCIVDLSSEIASLQGE